VATDTKDGDTMRWTGRLLAYCSLAHVLLVAGCQPLHRFAVEGRVLDEKGRPWWSAQTEIRALNLTGEIGDDGRFRLAGEARAGCYAARIFPSGGSEVVITFDPSKRKTQVIGDIPMRPTAVATPAQVVVGCYYPQDSLAVSDSSLGVDTIRVLRRE
jgi:hypothetical protein